MAIRGENLTDYVEDEITPLIEDHTYYGGEDLTAIALLSIAASLRRIAIDTNTLEDINTRLDQISDHLDQIRKTGVTVIIAGT